jgi:serine protease Do
MNGDVIGIKTAIFGKGGSIGIGFSIPSNSAKKVVSQLIEFGETKRGWLGVRIQVVTKEIADVEKLDEPRGALVASVAEKSPSDKAGIKAGDIILEFNGTKIKEMKELPTIVAQTEVGKTIEVKVWRNKREITKKIKLGRLETSSDFKKKEPKDTRTETPEISEIKSLKIIVRPLNDNDIKERKLPNQTTGLVITNIGKNSPVDYLNVGDIIVEAQKKKIKSAKNLENILDTVLKSNQKTILIVIYNNQNQRRYIGVKLD